MADGALEIHHIDIAGGDATAILVKDDANKITSKVLIDAGAAGGGSQSLKSYITAYLEPATPFDLIIASHYHDDHIKGFYESEISCKSFIDIGGYTLTGDTVLTPINGTGIEKTPGYFSGYYTQISKNIKNNSAKRLDVPFIHKDGSGTKAPLVIKLGSDTDGATLTCYCTNGVLADGTNVLAEQKKGQSRAFDPNDLSFAFILTWDTFNYFTAGDLSGDPSLKSYYNLEGKLVTYLQGLSKIPVTAMKVTHHGSERSSYYDDTAKTGFLNALNATTLILPCNIIKKVPNTNFLSRLNTYATAKNQSIKDAATKGTPPTAPDPQKFVNIYIVNDLAYSPSDSEYAGLSTIIGNADFNCNAVIKDKIISNDAKSIIIRRLAGGKTETSTKSTDETIYTRTDNGGKTYYVIVRNGKFVRKGGTLHRPDQYRLNSTINFDAKTAMLDLIKQGFALLTTQVVAWLTQDQTAGKQDGKDYIEDFYPSLFQAAPLPANLATTFSNKLLTMFNTVYTLQTFTDPDGTKSYAYVTTGKQLGPDDQKTIYNVLMSNKYQVAVAQGMMQKTVTWFWNDEGEPYTKEVAEKRAAPIAVAVRQSKRQKTK
jgi:hypothetical protein